MVRNLFIRSQNMTGVARGAGESRCPKSGLTRYFDTRHGV